MKPPPPAMRTFLPVTRGAALMVCLLLAVGWLCLCVGVCGCVGRVSRRCRGRTDGRTKGARSRTSGWIQMLMRGYGRHHEARASGAVQIQIAWVPTVSRVDRAIRSTAASQGIGQGLWLPAGARPRGPAKKCEETEHAAPLVPQASSQFKSRIDVGGRGPGPSHSKSSFSGERLAIALDRSIRCDACDVYAPMVRIASHKAAGTTTPPRAAALSVSSVTSVSRLLRRRLRDDDDGDDPILALPA